MHNWDGSWRINFSTRFSPSFALPRILLWSFTYFTAVLAVDTPRYLCLVWRYSHDQVNGPARILLRKGGLGNHPSQLDTPARWAMQWLLQTRGGARLHQDRHSRLEIHLIYQQLHPSTPGRRSQERLPSASRHLQALSRREANCLERRWK